MAPRTMDTGQLICGPNCFLIEVSLRSIQNYCCCYPHLISSTSKMSTQKTTKPGLQVIGVRIPAFPAGHSSNCNRLDFLAHQPFPYRLRFIFLDITLHTTPSQTSSQMRENMAPCGCEPCRKRIRWCGRKYWRSL